MILGVFAVGAVLFFFCRTDTRSDFCHYYSSYSPARNLRERERSLKKKKKKHCGIVLWLMGIEHHYHHGDHVHIYSGVSSRGGEYVVC